MNSNPPDTNDPSNDILMQRARHLDPDALAQIHHLFYPEIYRYVRFRIEDEMMVEDIASQVFMRLCDELKKKRGPDRNLRGWLFGTASHLTADHFRRHNGSHKQPIDQVVENQDHDPGGPGTVMETLAIQGEIRRAILKLTGDQQHVLALRFAGGFSLEQIAKLMAKNVNAIKTMQYRALASLRRFLAEDQPVEK